MGILSDLKVSFRGLGKHSLVSVVAVLTLGLGIGANTAIFTLVNAVLFKELPFDRPDEIVSLTGFGPMSYPDFVDIEESMASVRGLAAFARIAVDVSSPGQFAERTTGAFVTSDTFSLLGEAPLLGRDFDAFSGGTQQAPTVLISYDLWQRRYGADADALGQPVLVDRRTYTIIGVMAPGMKFPFDEDVWIPLDPNGQQSREQQQYEVFGRLESGVTRQQSLAELTIIMRQLREDYPGRRLGPATVIPFADSLFYWGNNRSIGTQALIFVGAVLFVLLITCASVSHLLLSRAFRRSRDAAVRVALGAATWHIIRQVLIEGLLLSSLGGVLGLGLAQMGLRFFTESSLGSTSPYWIDFSMDHVAFLYFAAICITAGLLSAIVPALQLSNVNVIGSLKASTQGMLGSMRSSRGTSVLLIGEVGLTMVLLVGAALMIRSLFAFQQIDVGIQTDGLLTAQIGLPPAAYPEDSNRIEFVERMTERLNGLSSVDALTVASHTPGGGALNMAYEAEGAGGGVDQPITSLQTIGAVAVAPGYFSALGLEMIRGREFDSLEIDATVVNSAFAERHWPGLDPLGRRIRLGQGQDVRFVEVVGVSPHVFQVTAGQGDSAPMIYIPYRQFPVRTVRLLARGRTDRLDGLALELREELSSMDPDLPLADIQSVDGFLRERSWPQRVLAVLSSLFALIATATASIALYAVTAHEVRQKTREIGLRMALGATGREIMSFVLIRTLKHVATGLAIGMVLALAVSRTLASLLFGVASSDPATFVAVALLLMAVSLMACLPSALRAVRLDPSVALHEN